MKAVLKRGGLPAIAIILLSVIAAPLAAAGQQPARVPLVGFLVLYRSNDPEVPPLFDAFRRGLRERGYEEGHTISVAYRFAEERQDRLPVIAAELVGLKPDVIVVASTPATRALKQATATIPIVMTAGIDPVGAGLVGSLGRPGGNITGVSNISPQLSPKRLQLLKEVIPRLARVATLWNPGNPATALDWKETQGAARTLGIQLQSLEVRGPQDLDGVLRAAPKGRPQALNTLSDAIIFGQRQQVVDFVTRMRLPAMFHRSEFVSAGGLMSYGVYYPDQYRRAAAYVDKILKGATPADLPVEQPTRFELVINMKTATALGLTIPQSVLIRADQVIQ
jgi:putative ABC transport system substrate-binding protein